MAVTVEVKMTDTAWRAVATAGAVLLTSRHEGDYAITGGATAPTFADGGHTFRPREDKALTLTGTERLWVRRSPVVYVTADAPVA